MFNIFDIEKKYKDELETLEEWNYLRNYYREGNHLLDNYTVNKWNAIKSMFYGFSNWFKNYDYIIFSSTGARKMVDSKYYDTRSDYICEYLGKDNILFVEMPSPKHYSREETFSKRIVSERFIDFLTIIVEKLSKKRYTSPMLDKINDNYNLKINYTNIIKRFNARYKIYKILLKMIKPKYIFLNCFYDKQAIVKASYALDIKVIDIQHGIIGNSHSAYYSEIDLDKNYLPDYLFVFGEEDKKNLKESKLFREESIYPVGNYFLEILKNNFLKDKKLSSIISQYRLSIGVSLQWPIEKDTISFLNASAKEIPDVLFIFIPRQYEDNKYATLALEPNIIFYPKLDCYNIIMHCSFHCTAYSTCAMEAPSLGIPNILININNTTNTYMKNMFTKETTFTVDTENTNDFIDILKKSYNFDKIKTSKSNEKYFLNSYQKNITNSLNYLMDFNDK